MSVNHIVALSVTRRRGCQTKHWHRSQGAAEAHLRALVRLEKHDPATVAYPCRFCRGWHVGRKPLSEAAC